MGITDGKAIEQSTSIFKDIGKGLSSLIECKSNFYTKLLDAVDK